MDVNGDETSVTEAFFAQTGPPRETLLCLVRQAVVMRQDRAFLPDAVSDAMAELNVESTFAGTWGKDPVRQAHYWGAALILAAEDFIESACRLVAREPLPVFGHLVLARSALEACGRAQWLYEPGIGVRRRIARGMTERLYSLAEQKRLPADVGGSARIIERRRSILDEATRQGFLKVTKQKTPTTIGEPRLGATETVKNALGESDDPDLGHVLFGYFSAVSHGTAYGLMQSIGVARGEAPLQPDTIGHLKTESVGVNSAIAAMILAYVEAVERQRNHFGWKSSEWAAAVIEALLAVRRVFPS